VTGAAATAVAVAIIRHGGRCFLQRRAPAARVAPGLWEFPGGKLEPGEEPRAALLRELREEVGWVPDRAVPLEVVEHGYPFGTVVLHPFLCDAPPEPRPALATDLAWGWFTPAELARLAMPEANQALAVRIP
jgi:8-oxo-dGTP diphosphatase